MNTPHLLGLVSFAVVLSPVALASVPLLHIDTEKLSVFVDPNACRWSASVKGTPMQLNDVHFLPGDDPSGWTVTSSIDEHDINRLGEFTTVTLHGEKAGQLDFDYAIAVSRTGTDLLVSLGRANSTGHAVELGDMDVFVSGDARLGGTEDRWTDLGTHSRNRDYYELWPVIHLIMPLRYEVNHVVRDMETGNSLLVGHVTTRKGASRFEIAAGWTGKTPDRMQLRGYCSYKITIPAGEEFPGEELLIDFNHDAVRAMEHQADLIAIAHDIRLKQRRPINLDDREWVANDYSRFHGWMSGGSTAKAAAFFKEYGLDAFYWGLGGPAPSGSWGLYGSGGATQGRPSRVKYPAECFLPIHTPKYEGERVIDFSNPLTIRLERERAFAWVVGHEQQTGRVEMDFSDWWDKWPGQFDPFRSALETYHAAGAPWREVIDMKAPRMVIRSNMQPVDHSYGLVDICRVSEDADHGYENLFPQLANIEFNGLFAESVFGCTNRFFYNGRVFWNDGDGFHIYKYNSGKDSQFTAAQAKVDACFHAIAGSTLFVSEAFDVPYPADRIELLKRVSPPTMDTAYPVDLFDRKPAQVWNMPIARRWGSWNVVAIFNFTDLGQTGRGKSDFATSLDAARDLRLDPNKEYVAYEFWSRQLVGPFKGTFTPRALRPYDCDIYSVVEAQDHPVLISTSRHIRQMAVDLKDLAYDAGVHVLHGVSRAVAGDPYELRIYVPAGFCAKRVELSGGLTATISTDGTLLKVDTTTNTGDDVVWKVFF